MITQHRCMAMRWYPVKHVCPVNDHHSPTIRRVIHEEINHDLKHAIGVKMDKDIKKGDWVSFLRDDTL